MVAGDLVESRDVVKLHEPRFGPMHVVAFASGSGTNFREAVEEARESDGKFSIDLLVTDKHKKRNSAGVMERIGAIDLAEEFEIPVIALNGYGICGSWKKAKKTITGSKEYQKRGLDFNRQIAAEISLFEKRNGIHFDFGLLAGYMRIVQGALKRRFNGKLGNVHPAKLDVLDDTVRRYTGDQAVYDALKAGETSTATTFILADEGVDTGPNLVQGPNVVYEGKRRVNKAIAGVHQDKQKVQSDWPALRFALREIAWGELCLHRTRHHPDGNPIVVYQAKEVPYGGVKLGGK